jgi:hypothetical protein
MRLPLLKFKNGVTINGAHFDPEMVRVADAARITAPRLIDDTVWITSANDGKHSDTSLHYHNRAFDVRIRNVSGLVWEKLGEERKFMYNDIVQQWADDIKLRLGSDYDVIYGNESHLSHIHVEYDPK